MFQIKDNKDTGIQFANTLKNTPELNILTYLYYYNGAGIGVGDFNNDGWEDLYFVANQGANHLYLNQKNLQFREATPEILKDEEGWSTGVSVIDVNHDGWQDIYLCKVSGFLGITGKNKLFINRGPDQNGIPVFEEQASNYNLDIASLATQSSFFDYDKDGDLDMFLLNHSVHPNRTYGRGTKRKQIDSLSGDRLYRNDDGVFMNISGKAKIYQGKIGYGLGIATGDLNNNGFSDLYIGNDFFENDYLYINQKNGEFKELVTKEKGKIGHTSHFSMGIDIADINNDGLNDIISLDMLPEDLETYKASGTEYGYTTYNQYLKNGYQPQYMQNTLQLNRGGNTFSEIAFYSGIAATEWSWAPLIADLDNDGYKDIFISNGIKGATNDMDFISFIANEKIQKRINKGMKSEDLSLIKELPDKKASNYFYKNNGDLTFKNMSSLWLQNKKSYSNGAVFSDLDNDGDLDIITNNIDEDVFVYENKANELIKNNFIKVKLKSSDNNPDAVGSKVTLFANNEMQAYENYRTRGYLSSVSGDIHFGLGNQTSIDSIVVHWPNGNAETFKDLKINSVNVLERTGRGDKGSKRERIVSFIKNDSCFIPWEHKEFETKDFTSEPLAPYAISNEGPHVSVVDVNQDGLDDIFIPGGRFDASELLIQQVNGEFEKSIQSVFEEDIKFEDIVQTFVDIDGDQDLDLVILSAGNETFSEYRGTPRIYKNEGGKFIKFDSGIEDIKTNGSTVTSADIDLDGDIDLFIGSNTVPGRYGKTPQNYLMLNNGSGEFSDVTNSYANQLDQIGMVFDANFVDIDQDGDSDLIVVGHYMPISVFLNNGKGHFENSTPDTLQKTNGWWNCVEVADMDNDGDLDILAGNWGLNSRLSASLDEPIQLYRNDFDGNGKVDPIVTYFYRGKETPIATKDELSKQIPTLNKKFLSYGDFAKANFESYFPKSKITSAQKKEVYTLATTYFENKGNLTFESIVLPWETQISSVHDMCVDDVNGDNFPDIILGGNTYEINTQLSRLDASYGSLLINDGKGNFKDMATKDFKITGAVRSIQKLKVNEEEYFLFGINNDSLQLAKKIKN
ncbi:VCBS repeat-containing protein [Aquimarina sp. D1M17]|uniref:VCBS repeat-containing protein n=1 Tax=Aquimarina acroporae TaxID=2937283 RepID=UPI0020C12C50|nr:VCBS repeat-containing protein [Aquimarina acroporae]MCK8521141.1 VCBS repeat-containing protein [Aquimarina acroporae]